MQIKISAEQTAFAVSIIGIAALLFFQISLEPQKTRIGEIASARTGTAVETQGRANWFSENEKTISFELYDGNKIMVLKTNPSSEERLLVREKKFLLVTGKISSYKNRLQILAEKISEKS